MRKSDQKTVAVKFVTEAKNLTEINNNIILRETGVKNVNRMLEYEIDHKAKQFALVLQYVPMDLFNFVTEYEPTEAVCKIIMANIISAVTDMSKLAGLVHMDSKGGEYSY